MKKFNGFSLMEMMVVLTIVAIVAAVAAPMVNKKILATANEKSPWVFTGDDFNIAYNVNANSNMTTLIGGAEVPIPTNDNGFDNLTSFFPKLYINTDGDDLRPQISFGHDDRADRLLNLYVRNDSIWFSKRRPNNSEGVVAIGFDSQAQGDESVAIIGNAQEHSVAIYGRTEAVESVAIRGNATGTAENSVAICGTARASGNNNGAVAIRGDALQARSVAILGTANGTDSVAIGGNATANNSVSINGVANSAGSIAIGQEAEVEQNAQNSIAIGQGAVATAQNSVALGQGASVTASNSVAIGQGAVADTFNQIVLGRSDANPPTVVIPGNLIVRGTVRVNRATTLRGNTTVGGTLGVTGTTTLDGNTTVGGTLDVTGATKLNDALDVTGATTLDGSTTLKIEGKSYPLESVYTERKYNSGNSGGIVGTYYIPAMYEKQSSDRRLKNVGEAFTAGLEEIKKLEVFNYTFKKDESKTPRVGVMAQDLEKIFPKAVFKGEDGFLRIRMEDMFYALVNAVKQLDAKIEELKNNEILTLKNRLDDLEKTNKEFRKENKAFEKRLDKLEKKLNKKLKD